tara:strand:+ start:1638 stop:2750 length:1113 start_codon:yes stop_codon:yes gene_type:complete
MTQAEKWVVKAGSSLVSGNQDGINKDFISKLALQIDFLKRKNQEVIIISSGAVAKGMNDLGFKNRPDNLATLQACAAVGQRGITEIYQRTFKNLGYMTGQVLITHDDIANRTRYLNAKNTLEALLELDIIPIVNENDCVATEEISFGDNDRLGAALAGLIRADKFIMLTDQEGIFSDDPTINENAQLFSSINLDDKTMDLSQQLNSSSGILGRGGMRTKIEAAKTSLNSGAMTWVASGLKEDTLLKIYNNEEVGSKIISDKSKLQSRKLWISSFGAVAGKIVLDEGACEAVENKGKSLLSVGITKVVGKFNKGDLVSCLNPQGDEIARGLSNFNNLEVDKIKGMNTDEIKSDLGISTQEEVIHRNNLVLS